jgi:hypothetical protein
MKCVRVVMALVLLIGCMMICSEAQGRQAVATIKFVGGTPLPGSKAGEITITVQWANCTNVADVTANCWTAKKAALVTQQTVTGTKASPLNANGSYSRNVTNLPSGTVIAVIEAVAIDKAGNVICNTGPLDSSSKPVPFNGCTVP